MIRKDEPAKLGDARDQSPVIEEYLATASRAIELPPGPSSSSFVQLIEWSYSPLRMLERCHRRYGESFTLRFAGFGTLVMLTCPEAIRQVFHGDPREMHSGEANRFLRVSLGDSSVIVLDDEPHARQRQIQQPAFKGERMRQFFDAVRARTLSAIERWPYGQPFPIDRSLRAITLEVILEVALGLKPEGDAAELLRRLRKFTDMGATPLVFFQTKVAEYTGLHRARFIPLSRNLRRIDKLLHASIRQRRNEHRSRFGAKSGEPDILDDLIQAKLDDGSTMGDNEIRDAMMTTLLAGHETTATALAWTMELILARPDVVARIRTEIDRVTGGGALQASHLADLVYLDAVIRESLRLRTVLPFVARLLKAPVEIQGRRYPPGVQLCPCIHLVHRREDRYPYAEEFRPERFLHRRFGPHEWLPFGGGNRICLGMPFALFEMQVVLATILTSTRLQRPAGAYSRVARRGIVLAPSDGTVVIRLRD